jgi:hypothetical protein
MITCSHMESYLNGQNILRKYLNKDSIGEPLVYLTCITSIMPNPCGNLTFSTWILLNESMLTHGIIIEWSKYHKKMYKV